jgi:hypothetical protein
MQCIYAVGLWATKVVGYCCEAAGILTASLQTYCTTHSSQGGKAVVMATGPPATGQSSTQTHQRHGRGLGRSPIHTGSHEHTVTSPSSSTPTAAAAAFTLRPPEPHG